VHVVDRGIAHDRLNFERVRIADDGPQEHVARGIHAHAVECWTPREIQIDACRRELAQIQVGVSMSCRRPFESRFRSWQNGFEFS
jgi:hypothetical protein